MILIRKATKNNIESIVTIQQQSWLDIYPNEEFGITKEDIEYRFAQRSHQESVGFLQKRFLDNKYTFLVGMNNKEVVGYLEIINEGEYSRIGALYIRADMRGKGIGKSLMEEGLKLLKDKKYITLEVAEYNTGAIRFYEKFGFVLGKEIVKEFIMPLSGKSILCKEMRKYIF